MLTQQHIDDFCEELGGALDGLWSYIRRMHGIPPHQEDLASFEERKNDFLFLIGKLLDEGRLKLAKKGEFITGTTEELVEMFRKSFPTSDEEMEFGSFQTTVPLEQYGYQKGRGKMVRIITSGHEVC